MNDDLTAAEKVIAAFRAMRDMGEERDLLSMLQVVYSVLDDYDLGQELHKWSAETEARTRQAFADDDKDAIRYYINSIMLVVKLSEQTNEEFLGIKR